MMGIIQTTTTAAALRFSSSSARLRFLQGRFARARAKGRICRLAMMPRPPASASLSTFAGDDDDGSDPKPWLLVGLGNPGKIFQGTRHNVGFELIDAIAEAEGISVNTIRSKALFGKGYIGDVPVMLAKPQTFMNASGESVGSLVSYFKIPLNQVLLMFDDMNLPFGKLRLLYKGGHGGHNGMKSVINHLKGTREIQRLRIGIGRPPGKMDPANFVLRPFDKKEREEIDFTFLKAQQAVRILMLEGFDKSATFTNSAQPPELLNR